MPAEIIPIRGHGREHPALSTILWHYVPPHCEKATYAGHDLMVEHIWPPDGSLDIGRLVNVGYIDGRMACRTTGSSMQHICELLFAEVDKINTRTK